MVNFPLGKMTWQTFARGKNHKPTTRDKIENVP
jgi:hypothetical protein